MVKSITKGKRFENEIAKWLSTVTSVNWVRILTSGGYATIHDLHTLRGDVTSESELFKDLVIECKDHNKPVNLQDFNNPKSDLNQFIAQTKAEAKERPWLLFIHWNRSPVFMVASTTDDLPYAKGDGLNVIFKACRPVCKTGEYLFMQIIE